MIIIWYRAFQAHDQEKTEIFEQLRKAEELNLGFDNAIRKEQLRRGVKHTLRVNLI